MQKGTRVRFKKRSHREGLGTVVEEVRYSSIPMSIIATDDGRVVTIFDRNLQPTSEQAQDEIPSHNL